MSYDEEADIDECWRHIEEGKVRKFKTAAELLKGLHGEPNDKRGSAEVKKTRRSDTH